MKKKRQYKNREGPGHKVHGQSFKAEPKFIPFPKVKVLIPRRFILKCLSKEDFLVGEETRKLGRKLGEIEKAINQLKHAQSLIEKCLWKKKERGVEYL